MTDKGPDRHKNGFIHLPALSNSPRLFPAFENRLNRCRSGPKPNFRETPLFSCLSFVQGFANQSSGALGFQRLSSMTELNTKHHTLIQALLSRGPLTEDQFHRMFSDLTGENPGLLLQYLSLIPLLIQLLRINWISMLECVN